MKYKSAKPEDQPMLKKVWLTPEFTILASNSLIKGGPNTGVHEYGGYSTWKGVGPKNGLVQFYRQDKGTFYKNNHLVSYNS